MKSRLKELFSFSALESANLNRNPNKIELQSCLLKEIKCKEHISMINKLYVESDKYRVNKEFQRSVEKLKSAFVKTTELKDATCMKCTELFRSTITDSLTGIKYELGKMTTGFLGNKHYQANYILVDKVLQEFENPELFNVVQQKKSKEHYIGPYLKKSVS